VAESEPSDVGSQNFLW